MTVIAQVLEGIGWGTVRDGS